MIWKVLSALALVLAVSAPAYADEVSEEDITRINALLAEMQCEMDEEEIEVEDEGFELDDVFCADGQYDIELNENFEVVEKRKE